MTGGRHSQVRRDRLLIEIVARRVTALEGRRGSAVRRAMPVCLGVLGVAVGALVALQHSVLPQAEPAFAVVLLLALLTGSAGSAAALLCVFSARLTGEPRTTWIGLALCWYCLFPVPVTTAHLLGSEHQPVLEASVVLAHVSTAVVLLLLVWAPEPPSVGGVLRVGACGVLVAGAGTAGLGWGFDQLVGVVAHSRTLGLVLALAWLVAGLAVAASRRCGAHVVIGIGLALLGSLQVWRATTPPALGAELAPTFAAARLGAVLIVFAGSLWLVRVALVELDREQAAQERELRLAEAELARAQARDHELRNGLAGLAGATRLLDRDELVGRAVASELHRLDVMLDTAVEPETCTSYAVAPVVEGLVALRRTAGHAVDLQLPSGLCAVGSSRTLAAVVTNLLANSERHAPGSPVTVTTRYDAGRIQLEVRDHGPGIVAGAEETVFEPGVRDPTAGGRGLGLPLCRGLLAAEGASIEVAPPDPDEPGCRVVVTLPAAPMAVRTPPDAPAALAS